jgi:hypothetical protein
LEKQTKMTKRRCICREGMAHLMPRRHETCASRDRAVPGVIHLDSDILERLPWMWLVVQLLGY